MRILGIDPGIGRTGWGVIDETSGKISVVAYGCLETPVNGVLAERLVLVHEGIVNLINTHNPEALSIEELFFNTNAKTALIVGQARGVVLLAAAKANLQITSYTPLQVKMSVTGYGRAEKNQISQMVKTILQLEKIPKPDDVTDALAIALTHAFSYRYAKAKQI